jgi:hypothetical protein
MSEPFRDELAAAHEKLRRKDEEIAHLTNDKRMLEARLSFPQRPKAMGILVGVLIAATSIFAAAFVFAQRANAQREAALQDRLAVCMTYADPAKMPRPKDRGDFPPKPKCTCAAGDPLCGCE